MGSAGKYRFWEIRRPYGMVISIGLLTAGLVVLFDWVNLAVIYRYMRLDFYLCGVAVFFLGVGWLLHRRRSAGARGGSGTLSGGMVEEGTVGAGAAAPAEVMATLSAKEWQILKLVAEGMTNKEIAAAQFVELSTVKTHLNNIYGKLSVSNRKEARVRYAELAPKWPNMG